MPNPRRTAYTPQSPSLQSRKVPSLLPLLSSWHNPPLQRRRPPTSVDQVKARPRPEKCSSTSVSTCDDPTRFNPTQLIMFAVPGTQYQDLDVVFPEWDYHHQLTLILDVLGTPTLDELYAVTTRQSRDHIRALSFRKRRPFAQIFPNTNLLAIDFLTKTLVMSPSKACGRRAYLKNFPSLSRRRLIPTSGSQSRTPSPIRI